MHRIEVMCDCVITISGAVCANVRKNYLSRRLSFSLFIARFSPPFLSPCECTCAVCVLYLSAIYVYINVIYLQCCVIALNY